MSHWAEAKSSLEEITVANFEKENDLKLKIMKNKFDADLINKLQQL